MAVINFARKEIEAKIVYYGPAFSGKTTNVQVLHGLTPDKQRGELHSLATEADRTLFFDYVPIQMGQVGGFDCRFKLFTVPGQVLYQQTRRVVLQGADAVVFIADSSPDRADANLDSLVDLEENLRAHGLDLASIPLVLQLNKRDAVGARTVEDMLTDLNPFGVPYVEAIASKGTGVMETLKLVTGIAAQRVRENLSGQKTAMKLTAVEKSGPEDDKRVVRDHIERIRKVRPEEVQKEQQMQQAGRVHMEKVDAFLAPEAQKSESNGYEVSRPRPLPNANATSLRPPPPIPASSVVQPPKVEYPAGPSLEAMLKVDGNFQAREVLGAIVGPDGRARVELVMEQGGKTARHTITLVPNKEEPPPAGTNWVMTIVVGILAIGIGLVLGIGIGWALFQG